MASDLQYVKGLAALGARLQRLPSDLQRKVLRGAVLAGAKVVRERAARLAIPPIAPISTAGRHNRKERGATGVLSRAAIVKFAPELSNDAQIEYLVTFRHGKRAAKSGADAFYAPFVERGHRIVARGAKATTLLQSLRSRDTLKLRREQARASGARVPAHPFLGPAFEQTQQQALEVIVSTIERRLDAVLRP